MAKINKQMNRRALLRNGAIAMAGAAASGCVASMGQYPPIPAHPLNGYPGIADLPYFELDDQQRPVLIQSLRDEMPMGIDFHTHLGHSFLMAPEIDYQVEHNETDYLVNCKKDDERCAYNVNDYLNKIAKPELLKEMDKKILTGLIPGGSDAAKTHTIPNLVQEMSMAHIDKSVLLAVAPRLPFRNNPTEQWIEALAASPHKDRFILFGTVHTRDSSAVARIRKYAEAGVRGIKLHPTMQQFRPDEKSAMQVYEVCEELGLIVFFHAGRAGIEPAYSRQFAQMKHYIEPARVFPRLQFVFGHGGARDWREAMDIAANYSNVWLEIEGQGAYELQKIMAHAGTDRLLFGSDWPFYPESASLVRLLIATEGDKNARDAIFAHNGRRLLGLRAG